VGRVASRLTIRSIQRGVKSIRSTSSRVSNNLEAALATSFQTHAACHFWNYELAMTSLCNVDCSQDVAGATAARRACATLFLFLIFGFLQAHYPRFKQYTKYLYRLPRCITLQAPLTPERQPRCSTATLMRLHRCAMNNSYAKKLDEDHASNIRSHSRLQPRFSVLAFGDRARVPVFVAVRVPHRHAPRHVIQRLPFSSFRREQAHGCKR